MKLILIIDKLLGRHCKRNQEHYTRKVVQLVVAFADVLIDRSGQFLYIYIFFKFPEIIKNAFEEP